MQLHSNSDHDIIKDTNYQKKSLNLFPANFHIEASASFVRLRATLSFPLLSLLIQQLLDQVSYARRDKTFKLWMERSGRCLCRRHTWT